MSGDPLTTLWILWGCVTAALAGLLIYRSLIGMKEDDQLFLNTASPNESPLVAEQQAVVMRLNRLTPYIKILALASALLLICAAGLWVYRGVVGVGRPTFEP
jgi:hypothetical protein